MTREEELDLIRRVQRGDAEAFEPLMLAHQKAVYNLALRLTENPQDAEDMAQEAFLKAYRSLPEFRGDCKFSVWLYRIVTNVSLDYRRKQKRRPASSLTVEDEEGEEQQMDIPDASASPEKLLERKLTREAVRRGMDALTEDQRKILLLREISGLSYEEIGETLGLEAGTVKSRISRARKKLCDFLRADGNIPDAYASNRTEGG